jgi:dihydrolipoamide dehydrogenase
MADYDVIVIGGGPGGYVAAIRCAQLGLNTVCIDAMLDQEGKSTLGGVCLNSGCIPSKALLDSSHHYHRLKNGIEKHGIKISGASIDIKTMMNRKSAIVDSLTKGVESLFVKNKVKWIKGYASLSKNHSVTVTEHNGGSNTTELSAKHIIIATGSSPVSIDSLPLDGKQVVDSTGALSFDEVPKRFAVIGAGVVGLELGSVWNRLGAETVVFNRGKKFLKSVDQQLAKAAKRELERQGLKFKLGVTISQIKKSASQVTLHYKDDKGSHTDKFEKILVCTGRRPNSDKLNADAVGLHINARGFIEVDDLCRTNLDGVFAIGDVVRGPMLAHKASEEGIAVAERIAGHAASIDFNTVPWVIYTWPEIAWVGRTEEQLQDQGTEFVTGVFPFMASGRALAMGDSTGLVKVISDAESDRILGVHIFGPNASELISEAVVAMEFAASAEDLARTIHAHPTLSEAVHEAALAVDNRAIHI